MDHVAGLRAFNRAVTRHIGLLDESYLDSGRSLGASRLLFEIGASGAQVSDLRRRLGLDSGYLSRLLRGLEDEGLLTVRRDPTDGRQRVAHLTPDGRREWRRLDQRAHDVAADLLDPLSARQRSQLTAALETAQRLLGAATVTFDPIDPGSDVARSVIARYFDELDTRFPTGFDPDSGGAGTDVDAFRAPRGALMVVSTGDTAIGCGAVQAIDAHTGEIKRMWIHPDWRGLGLGHRLLAHLEAVAVDLGYARVVLDTNDTLVEAIAMYERAGYLSIERYNDNPYARRWFAKDLGSDASTSL